MLSSAPIERTIASERGCTGRSSTRRFQWLSAGKTGQPARTAAPSATLPYKSAGVAGGAEAARLALGEAAVAPDVAVLAAGDEVERRLIAHVPYLPYRGGVHASEAARTEDELGVVVQANLDAPAMNEVELLLLLVEVAAGLEPRRDLDRVHAEGGHAELAPDLAEAGAVAEPVDVRDGIAVALRDLADLVLVSHARKPRRSIAARHPWAMPVRGANGSGEGRHPVGVGEKCCVYAETSPT